MTRARMRLSLAAAVVVCAVGFVARAQPAEDEPLPPEVRVRSDSLIRWAPRYRVTSEESPTTASREFWDRVDRLPLYSRLALDATHLASDHVDVHISAWAALDLRMPSDDDTPLAGDFGVAYANARLGPFVAWGGRRFVPWGRPGGVHLDGGGLSVRLPLGFYADLVGGRPVTPSHDSSAGGQLSFSGPTGAGGLRLGFARPGTLAVSVSYLERWAEGILADRTVSLDAAWSPWSRLDVRANAVLDATGVGIEQAGADVYLYPGSRVELDVAFTHVDPRRLLPAWSILSVFASSLYDEASAGATWRVVPSLSLRAEAALRAHHSPGEQRSDDTEVGYRSDLAVRLGRPGGRLALLARVSRRDDGTLGYTLLTTTAAWQLRPVDLTLDLAGAIDDDGHRDSALVRVSGEVPVSTHLRVGTTLDWARTPAAESELRALLRVSYVLAPERGSR